MPRRRPKPVAKPDTSGVVKRARKRLGISQQKLSEMIGVSKRTVVRWENGWPFPSQARQTLENLLRKKKSA